MELEYFLKTVNKNCTDIKKKSSLKHFGHYNFFKVLDIGSKEVLTCRFLADLLDPNGKHGCGTLFLKAFFEKIDLPADDEILKDITVETEYLIKDDRRIDIAIYNSRIFIPIEVKIYADEQKDQCLDYYNFAKTMNNGKDFKLIYLTRFGNFPSLFSTGNRKEVQMSIKCISFAKEIREMLENCLSSINNTLVRTAVESFIDMITEHSDPIYKEEKNMFEKLYENEENFRAAIEIENHIKSLNAKKIEIMTDLLSRLENKVNNLKLNFLKPITENKHHYYIERADIFFENKQSSYPGFDYSITVKHVGDTDIDIRFRVEIDHRLFAGICVYDIKNDKECDLRDHSLILALSDCIKNAKESGTYWTSFVYLPTGNNKTDRECRDKVPNFKTMNEAALRLFNEAAREEFANECTVAIKDYLDKTINKK